MKKLLFGEAYGVSTSYTIGPSYNNCGLVMSQQPTYLQCPIQQVSSYHYSKFWTYNDVYEGDSRDKEEEVMNVEFCWESETACAEEGSHKVLLLGENCVWEM